MLLGPGPHPPERRRVPYMVAWRPARKGDENIREALESVKKAEEALEPPVAASVPVLAQRRRAERPLPVGGVEARPLAGVASPKALTRRRSGFAPAPSPSHPRELARRARGGLRRA
jgi:hypothetical protein